MILISEGSVEGRSNVHLEAEIIQQRVEHPKSGSDGGSSIAERVPGNADPGTKQPGRLVIQERIVPDVGGTGHGVTGEKPAGIWDELGSPSILLVPTVREFVPNSNSDGKIGAQLHDVLNIPGPFHRSPVHESTIGRARELCGDPLQESKEAGKLRLSVASRRRVRTDLDSLKPAPKTELVLPADELHIIRAGEHISIVPNVSGNAGAGRSEVTHRGSGCPPDTHGSRRFARKQGNVRRKRNQVGRIEIERRAREPRPDGVEELRGKHVGFLRASDLAPKERNGPEKWVRER